MRLFADTNIAAPTVKDLRRDGHDVIYSGEWRSDPGDLILLLEAKNDDRIFVTKDHDLGVLVFRDGAQHAGVLLIDDLASPAEETALIRSVLESHSAELAAESFVRAGAGGARVATTED